MSRPTANTAKPARPTRRTQAPTTPRIGQKNGRGLCRGHAAPTRTGLAERTHPKRRKTNCRA
eukprot:11180505-Lingulodinium_polyedra.AAC.1